MPGIGVGGHCCGSMPGIGGGDHCCGACQALGGGGHCCGSMPGIGGGGMPGIGGGGHSCQVLVEGVIAVRKASCSHVTGSGVPSNIFTPF